jgi:DNA polymerase
MKLQLEELHNEINQLQEKFGDKNYCALYGAGCTKNPDVYFLFMNPTAKNLSVDHAWQGIRAPWLGLKNTWKLLYRLDCIDEVFYETIMGMKPADWSYEFSEKLYKHVADKKIYLSNLARCTQPDARHVPDIVFRESKKIALREIQILDPKVIIAFGNQVSSNLLGKDIRVSEHRKKKTMLDIDGKEYPVYPVYYPVGMGMRNMPKAISDIRAIMKIHKK